MKAEKSELNKLQRDKIDQMKEKQLEQESLDEIRNQILSLNRLFEGFSQSLTEEIIYSKKKTEKKFESLLNENMLLSKRLTEVEGFLKRHIMHERISSQNEIPSSQKFDEGFENEYKDRRRAVSQDSIEKIPTKNNQMDHGQTSNINSSHLDELEEVFKAQEKEPKSPVQTKRKKTFSENASPTHLIGKNC